MKRHLLILGILTFLFSAKAWAQSNQTVNNGENAATVNFAGCVYNWTNDKPGIGLAANGTGNISSFKAVNTGNTPIIATITATPVSSQNAYITSSDDPGTVTVVNTATNKVTATITVGKSPIGVSATPDGSRVYVANSFSNTVSVINTLTNTVVATVPVGNFPNSISVSYDGNSVYVANVNDKSVSVISTATNKVTATFTGFTQPFGLKASTTTNLLYVANSDGNTISVVNTTTGKITATVTVGDAPWQIAVTPDGTRIYVTNIGGNTVSVIDAATNAVIATIPVGLTPEAITVSPDGTLVYAGIFNAGNVTVISTATNAVVQTLTAYAAQGLSVTPDGKTIYVVNNNASGTVTAINTATGVVVATIPTGGDPISYGNFIAAATCAPVKFTITVNPTPAAPPTITASAATGTIFACAGTASASPQIQQFTVSGSSLTSNITASVPPGFEVSLSAGGGYGSSVIIPQTGGAAANTVVYVRSASSDPAGPVSGNITLTSSGATSQNVAVTGTVSALPTVSTVPPQSVNNGASTTAINFTGTGNTFTWTNNTPGIGLAASGTGDIASFTAVNTSNTPVIATITVTPFSLGYAYIANSSANDVSVINTQTNTVASVVPVGSQPFGVSVSPDGSRVYVANEISGTVSVINTSTNAVTATITVGAFPIGIAVSPDGNRVYVVNSSSNTVSVIDASTNAVIANIPVAVQSIGAALSPDGSKLYVTNASSNTVTVINTVTNAVVTTVPVGAFPDGVAVSPDGSKVYVVNGNAGTVSVIDAATNIAQATITAGTLPYGISVSPDGSRLYVANNEANTVSVINTLTGAVVSNILVGSKPYGISVSPDGQLVYAVNTGDNTVSVISTATNAVIKVAPVGASPGSFGNFVRGGTGCSGEPITFTIMVNPTAFATITAAGTLSPLITTYGTPSVSTSFTVSGTDLTTGILVTPPPGFEVSTDNVNFTAMVTIGSGGEIASTTVYIRLAAITPVGNYSGNIKLSSTGAPDANVIMPLSTVTPALLTIIADDKSKSYDTPNPVLTASYIGFVNFETPAVLSPLPLLSTIAVTASPVGQYPITAGGAASPNYMINYLMGTLTVLPAVQSIVIPNTFTPNGDGVNDTWDIKYLDFYTTCSVQIFNRWGQNVYSSIGYGTPWNGTYKGAVLPTGTYYYVIDLKNNSKLLSGFVAIVR